jgi:hypothetical protein
MGDKYNIKQPIKHIIKEIELKDINICSINTPKKIEYNKECEDIKGIIKKYVENKLKS